MAKTLPNDKSNGYDEIAETFMRVRNPRIGPGTVLEWSQTLAPGTTILDLGCGHGAPISQALNNRGFPLYGIDASAKMIAAFRLLLPSACAECAAVEDSEFFGRSFDAVVAWGLMFLLPKDVQATVIGKVARALTPGGKFVFTSPRTPVTWPDSLTGRESISLGAEEYERILHAHGLTLVGDGVDEGENYYYFVSKPR